MFLATLSLGASQLIALFTLLWGGLMLLAYLLLPALLTRVFGGQRLVVVVLVLVGVALLVRGIPNAVLPVGAGFDIDSYTLVADSVLSGQDVYTSPDAMDRHPYLPFQMYWMAGSRWLADRTGIAYVRIVRLAPIFADVCIAVLIFFYLQRRTSDTEALRGGLLYALNPISIFVSAFHGQFDAIPLLFLLLAVVTHGCSLSASALCLGLGVLNKSWPVLGLPSLVWRLRSWRRRTVYLLLTCLVPVLGVLIYGILFRAQLGAVVGKAVGYDWGVGAWGYTYLLRLFGVLLPSADGPFSFALRYGRFVTLAALALVWLLRARDEAVPNSVLTVFVTFFACTHVLSIQYLVWLLPLAVICQNYRWLHRYTVAATAYMLLVYSTLILASHVTNLLPWPQADWFIIMPSGLPAWLVTVAWAVARWKTTTGRLIPYSGR